MKILFLNAYFLPETIAFTHLEQDIMDEALKTGNEITVICPVPTRGISDDVKREYRKIKRQEMFDGKVQIKRFWAPDEKRNVLVRAARYFWCNLRELSIAKKYREADVIFAVSTPPTQGLLCALIKKKLKKPFIYSLQDIFPDSLVTTSLAKEGSLVWKIGRKIENYTYKNADKIIVISQSFKENIMAKGVPEDKIEVIPNWIDTDSVACVEKGSNKLFDEYGIDKNKFIVVYAGNFGAAQGAEVVLDAAEKLRANKNIHFVIFGGGPGFDNIKSSIVQKSLDNITVDGLLPQERVSEVYSLGDVCLITCKKGVGKSGMPSKTWSIMACNTPIIAAFDTDSELADILKKSGAGICVEPEDPQKLADAILWFHNTHADAKIHNSRAFLETFASKKVCAPKYIQIMQELANKDMQSKN